MEQEFGCHLPKEMHPEFSAIVQKVSDATGNEIEPTSLWEIFERTYLDLSVPYEFVSFSTVEQFEVPDSVRCLLRVRSAGSVVDFEGSGNGPIDACRAALLSGGSGDFRIANYVEHARTAGSDAEAVAYIQIETSRGHLLWGVGIHSSIEKATVKAVLSAVNRMGGES
jgi:2-isopropylmalate synthase